MVRRIDSDAEEVPTPRPKRVAVPSAKVISADNAADQELLSHRRAHIASRATDALSRATDALTLPQPVIPPPSHDVACPSSSDSYLDANDSDIELIGHPKRLTKGNILGCFTLHVLLLTPLQDENVFTVLILRTLTNRLNDGIKKVFILFSYDVKSLTKGCSPSATCT
jgi:hypothetical protein